MTRKEKQQEKQEDTESTIEGKTLQENEKNSENAEKAEEMPEVKMLEEGDKQKVLEFYSIDELRERVKELQSKVGILEEKATKLEKERDDWKNKYMRLQAEFENAQKRWNTNRQNLKTEYTASTLKSFLPLYDSFKKALSNEDENSKILSGFYDQFMNIFKSYNAKPLEIKENEQFDYSVHEALSTIEKDNVPNNTIIDVIQDGWKLDKEVIRYAKVIISREPKPPEPEPKTEGGKSIEERTESQTEPEIAKVENSDIPSDEKTPEKDDKEPDYIS